MKKTTFSHKKYRGRFAPSPTGELHFGSLLAAMASYADAKSHQGDWLVRIDDIDQARVISHSDKNILKTLEQCGFQWDEDIRYQSQCLTHYQEALDKLYELRLAYACTCSRKELKEKAKALATKEGVYPGTCRKHLSQETSEQKKPTKPFAIRLKTPDESIILIDQIQGEYTQNLRQEVGDFIVYRKDHVFSYQLSVVVDDFQSQISHIVRGHDLLDSTPKQMVLQRLLTYPQPSYAHIPLAVSQEHLKLSKLSQAQKVDCSIKSLVTAAQFLGQKTLKPENFETKNDFWQHLIQYWDINRVPRMEKQMILV
ncbi:MAG: tRNA glutamyl-Q(34) synthetase GluQRS [Gammaproteobacteria bacterium]|nr:tRNA glutamyl-Q(34) synthetase GluQRS [Gammaproteobacteria bacterium]